MKIEDIVEARELVAVRVRRTRTALNGLDSGNAPLKRAILREDWRLALEAWPLARVRPRRAALLRAADAALKNAEELEWVIAQGGLPCGTDDAYGDRARELRAEAAEWARLAAKLETRANDMEIS